MISQWLVAMLVALVTSGVLTQDMKCTLPDFVVNRREWDWLVQDEGLSPDAIVMFDKTDMQMIYFTSGEDENWSCHKQVEKDYYAMKRYINGYHEYKCFQFHNTSPYVVQLSESSKVKFNATEPHSINYAELCDVSRMKFNDWPLIWTRVYDVYEPCSLVGGFEMTILSENTYECSENNMPVRPRIESECMYGESIMIDFKKTECKGSLSIGVQANPICLGSWERGNNIFMLISSKSGFFNNMWIIRYPKIRDDDFEMYFLKDIMTDNTRGVVHAPKVKFSLKKKKYLSLCEDEMDVCEPSLCQLSSVKGFCQKKCGNCTYLDSIGTCDFSEFSRGEWLESSQTSSRNIRISRTVLYVDSLPSIQCIDLPGTSATSTRRAVFSTFKNGCKPRYSCTQLQSVYNSTDVIQYNLNMSYIWPYKSSLTFNDLCGTGYFHNDKEPLGSEFRNALPKYLVTAGTLAKRRTSTLCDFPGTLSFTSTFQTSEICNGTMRQCSNPNQVMLDYDKTCPFKPNSRILNCLASHKTFGKVFLITEEDNNTSVIQCWNFEKRLSVSDNFMYLLHPADCNSETLADIKYEDSTTFIAEFKFSLTQSTANECKITDDIKVPTTVVTTESVTTTLLTNVTSMTSSKPLTTEAEIITTVKADSPATSVKMNYTSGFTTSVAATTVESTSGFTAADSSTEPSIVQTTPEIMNQTMDQTSTPESKTTESTSKQTSTTESTTKQTSTTESTTKQTSTTESTTKQILTTKQSSMPHSTTTPVQVSTLSTTDHLIVSSASNCHISVILTMIMIFIVVAQWS